MTRPREVFKVDMTTDEALRRFMAYMQGTDPITSDDPETALHQLMQAHTAVRIVHKIAGELLPGIADILRVQFAVTLTSTEQKGPTDAPRR